MPIITISRGTFSGGKDLAECLSKQLGYPCVSREVIVAAAEQYGASEAALSGALDQAPSLLDRIKRDRDRYLAYIRAALCKQALQGSFIYHGHGGHHLLAGIRHVIRLRVVADMGSRVEKAIKELNMTRRDAEDYVQKQDEQRRKWTRFLYGVAWEDPENYDVVINLEHQGISGACAIAIRMAELEQFQETPESRKALANLALQSAVLAALARDGRTRDADFRVRANDGVVTVEGMGRLPKMDEAVGEVVSGVEGVTRVVNQVANFGVPG